MKLFLGLLPSARPDQTRIFTEAGGKLIDLQLAYAALLWQNGRQANAYELASLYFHATIAAFIERDKQASDALKEVVGFARNASLSNLRGPTDEQIVYDAQTIRLL